MNDEATLAALRLGDSFLPVGSYTVSYAMEQFVQDGRVEDADDLRALLETYLRRQIGPCDAVALRTAHDAASGDEGGDLDGVAAVDERLTSVTLAAEFRESATASGRRLLDVAAETDDDSRVEAYATRVDDGEAPGNYAVAFGLVTACAGIPAREAALAYAHSFLTGLLGAAQRLVRLGHTEAQRLLADLHPVAAETIEANADRTADELEPFAPLVDVLAAEHERADRRLFVS